MRHSECKPGVPIYYHSPEGDTCPGEIIRCGPKRVLITCNGPERDGECWVSADKLELQCPEPSIRASVWIDGTGIEAAIDGRTVLCGSFRGTYGPPAVDAMVESCRQAIGECLDDFRRAR